MTRAGMGERQRHGDVAEGLPQRALVGAAVVDLVGQQNAVAKVTGRVSQALDLF